MHASFPLVTALVTLATGAALAPSQDVLERGRALSLALLNGDLVPLSASLSQKFLKSVGGEQGLAALATKLAEQAGRELAVLDEQAFHESGFTTYYRISRFEKLPSVTTRWVWNEEGLVVGGTVQPTPQPAISGRESYRTKTSLGLPLGKPEAGWWYVAWGGRDAMHNQHVTAADQRFAYDFLIMQGGRHHAGTGAKNEDHFCFGAAVVAPGDGTVLTATDAEPDNPTPGAKAWKTAPGNHVVIDHGGGEHSLIAHLRSGSVRVKAGQKLRRGEPVGECGNSGKSDLPHVHYHLQTGKAYRDGIGLPVRFKGYFLGGRLIPSGEVQRGDLIRPAN